MRVISFILLATSLFLGSCSKENKTKPVKQISVAKGWEFKSIDGEWLPAQIPGCIHTDLLKNELIPDPYFAANEDSLQWIDKRDWEYRTTINISQQLLSYKKLFLKFKGIDTYADIYLNDSILQSTDNMYREWMIDCKKHVQPGENSLRVVLKSPINEARPLWNRYNGAFPAVNEKTDTVFSVYTRKAPYHYGWDWGPRFVTMGIWKPVKIIGWNEAKVNDMHVKAVEIRTDTAKYAAHFDISSSYTQRAKLKVDCRRIGRSFSSYTTTEDIELSPGRNFYKVDIDVSSPELWWPNGHGEQPLYEVTSKLYIDEEVVETTSKKIGIRKLEVVQNQDSSGVSFYFKVNDRPIFMKGANYIPQEVFTPSVTSKRYNKLLETVVQSNMNMLRVWGGAIYESDEFYQLCDEKGILIWQDFMFSCAFYPANDTLAYTIKKEAIENIKRLRDHPSLALWCGNNEIEHGWSSWGWSKRYSKDSSLFWTDYDRIFNQILADAVNTYDADRTYIPTSPLNVSDNFDSTNGDHHEWKIWFGRLPFSSYNERIGRFNSEYGFQSYPNYELCKSMTGESNPGINSPLMKAHQKCHMDWYKPGYTGNDLIKDYMEQYYKIPDDPSSYVQLSQILQADALEIAIEAHRRNMPTCMGTLYWQINDCWPVISWATVDYEGDWKIAQYKIKESFKDLIINAYDDGDSIRVFGISDLQEDYKGILDIKMKMFNGDSLIDTSFTVTVPANSSTELITFPKKPYLFTFNKNYTAFYASIINDHHKIVDYDLLYFSPVKDMFLHDPKFSTTINNKGNKYTITLQSDTLVKGLLLSDGILDGKFQDVYVDIFPGVPTEIEYISDEPDVQLSRYFQATRLSDLYKIIVPDSLNP